MDNLKSKIVVVTGASSGVGRATAHEFAKSGAVVVMLARDREALEAVKKEVNDLGGKGHYYALDVSQAEEIDKAAEEIENHIGPIFCWVNNAMIGVFSPFKEMTATEFRRVTEVTYLGQIYGTMAALRYMLSRNQGKIVLVGSALAYRGIPLQSAYCGAKHGIQGFFDSLRTELIHDNSNIGLTMVELPALNTTQFEWVKSRLPNKPRPMGTIFQPEVAARAIKYAALNDRREIYVGMPTFKSIIGNKVFPGMLDRILARSGYKGQQTDEPEDPDRKNNLWEPLSELHNTHGRFDDLAKNKSTMLWVSIHWHQVWGMILAALVLIVALIIIL